jgi:hypothetical protein
MRKLVITEEEKDDILGQYKLNEYYIDPNNLPNDEMFNWVKKRVKNHKPTELSAHFRGMGNEKLNITLMDEFFERFKEELQNLTYTEKYEIYKFIREKLK